MTLLQLLVSICLLLTLNSCDLFGQDDGPKPKSTEFVFSVDTLTNISFYTVNDLDVIDDTSFVITGYFLERDENGNTKNTYNQIWWGMKKGYEFKSMLQKIDTDTFVESGSISFFSGNHNYYIYGGPGRVVIQDNGNFSYHFLGRNINLSEHYEHAELVRPGEFYLYS